MFPRNLLFKSAIADIFGISWFWFKPNGVMHRTVFPSCTALVCTWIYISTYIYNIRQDYPKKDDIIWVFNSKWFKANCENNF